MYFFKLQNDRSSESSESSGIYTISRSVSDDSVRDDQTNVKTLQIRREKMNVTFENPLTATTIHLPVAIHPSNESFDSEDNFTVSVTENMYEQDNLQQEKSEGYEIVNNDVATEFSNPMADDGYIQEKHQQGNDILNVVTEGIDDCSIHVTEANDEQHSNGYEIAGGLDIREMDCSSGNDGYLQENSTQRDISHLVNNTESNVHDGEINSLHDTTSLATDQFQLSHAMPVGEYFRVVASQSYDSDTISNDSYLAAHMNAISDNILSTIPRRQANEQVNALNLDDLMYTGNDFSTQSVDSCDDYVIAGPEEISDLGLSSAGEYSRAVAFETSRNSSTFTGLSSNHSEHLFDTVRSHVGASSSGSIADTDSEPLEDYQRAEVSTPSMNFDPNHENYLELIALTNRR